MPSGDWLDVPTGRLWAYVKMMGRLEAERSLTHVSDTAAAFGSMPEADQQRYMQHLRRDAMGAHMAQREKGDGAAATIAALGITVETIEGGSTP